VDFLIAAGHDQPRETGQTVVCDEPFAGMEVPVVASVLERLVRGGTSQVIYLTSDPQTLDWAKSIPPELGGLTTIPAGMERGPGPGPVTSPRPGLSDADRPAS
jgi:hypothetical protein